MLTIRRVRRAVGAAVVLALIGAGVAHGQLKELQLTQEPFDHINPQWGPDLPPLCDERGDFIAYEYVAPNGHHHLVARRFRLGGGLSQPIPLTDPTRTDDNVHPRFTPAGDAVVFVKRASSGRVGLHQVAVLDTSSGGFPSEVQLTAVEGEYGAPQVSPDGTMLAYERKTPQDATWQIWTLCIACRLETQRTFDSQQDSLAPFWAPDSNGFVFTRTTGGPGSARNLLRYTIVPAEGQPNEILLTSDAGPADYTQPSWTIEDADYGKYVVASRRPDPKSPYQIVQVTDDGSRAVSPLTGLATGACAVGDGPFDHWNAVAGPQSSKKIVMLVTDAFGRGPWLVRLLNNLRDDPPMCTEVLLITTAPVSNVRWDPNSTNAIYQKKVGDHWQIFIVDSVF